MSASATKTTGEVLAAGAVRPAKLQAQELIAAMPTGVNKLTDSELLLKPPRKSPTKSTAETPKKRRSRTKTKDKGKSVSAVTTEPQTQAQSDGAVPQDSGSSRALVSIKPEGPLESVPPAESEEFRWRDHLDTFFAVARKEKYMEQLRKSAGFGYKTHEAMYDEIAKAINVDGVDGLKAAKKMENMLAALRRYQELKSQTGTSATKLAKSRAADGVVQLEEILRKDRPRFEPGSVLDSAGARDGAGGASGDGGESASSNAGSSVKKEGKSNENMDAEDEDEPEAAKEQGSSKDQKKQKKLDPFAPASHPRPPGVSRKREHAKNPKDSASKKPRTASVKAATAALLDKMEEQDEERRKEREQDRQDDAEHRQQQQQQNSLWLAGIDRLAAAIEKSAPIAAAPAVPVAAAPAAPPPANAETALASLAALPPTERAKLAAALLQLK